MSFCNEESKLRRAGSGGKGRPWRESGVLYGNFDGRRSRGTSTFGRFVLHSGGVLVVSLREIDGWSTFWAARRYTPFRLVILLDIVDNFIMCMHLFICGSSKEYNCKNSNHETVNTAAVAKSKARPNRIFYSPADIMTKNNTIYTT